MRKSNNEKQQHEKEETVQTNKRLIKCKVKRKRIPEMLSADA
jgi:hypothetical protein